MKARGAQVVDGRAAPRIDLPRRVVRGDERDGLYIRRDGGGKRVDIRR